MTEKLEEDVREVFARASRLEEDERLYLTPEEWRREKVYEGARKFKRKVLGYFREQTVKSIDELACVLQELGIFKSVEEARKFIPKLYERELKEGDGHYLEFEKVLNPHGVAACRITRYYFGGA